MAKGRRVVVLPGLLFALIGAQMPAQVPAQMPAQVPAFRASVNRIQVDVRASDDDGPVEDLTASDFRVFEDGIPVDLVSVELVAPAGTLAAGTGRRPDPEVVHPPVDAAQSLSGSVPGAIVFLVDTASLSATTKARFAAAWAGILDSTDVSGIPRAAYYVDRSGDIVELAPLTADAQTLRASADVVAALPVTNERRAEQLIDLVSDLPDPRAPQPDAFGGSRSLDIVARPAVAKMRIYEDEEKRRALTSIRALSAFCDALWVVEGRKTVIWVSSGLRLMSAGPTVAALAAFEDEAQRSLNVLGSEVVPGIRQLRADLTSPDPQLAQLLDALFETANDANVGIYPIDPTPLVEARMPGVSAQVRGGVFRAGLSDPLVIGALDALGDGLRQTAESTGGRAFVHATDLGAAMNDIIADSSRYYLLTYAPPRAEADGQHHSIRVEVTRPGVSIRARTGYVHLSESARAERMRDVAAVAPGLVADAVALAAARQAVAEEELVAARQAAAEGELVAARQAAAEEELVAARQAAAEEELVAGAPAERAAPAATPVTPELPDPLVGQTASTEPAAVPPPTAGGVDTNPNDEDASRLLERALRELAQTALSYRERALTFTCDEDIAVSVFNSSGGFRRRATYELRYIYTFEDPPPDAAPGAFRRLRDFRTRRDDEEKAGQAPREVTLRSLDLPAATVRAYSWAFLFQAELQAHYRFDLIGEDRQFGRPAQVISFEPVPPLVAGFNDWFGRAWVDTETHQVLRVDALQAGDYAELDAIENDRLKLEVPRDGRLVVRLDAEFEIDKDGMRLPSKVTLTGEDFSMRSLPYNLPGNVAAVLPEWELKGRVAFRVEQTYENYRFFDVQVR